MIAGLGLDYCWSRTKGLGRQPVLVSVSKQVVSTATLVKRVKNLNSSDGEVVRASASGAIDLGLIPSQVKPMTLKMVFTASLLDAQHERDCVENKTTSLLVAPLGKALSGTPPC